VVLTLAWPKSDSCLLIAGVHGVYVTAVCVHPVLIESAVTQSCGALDDAADDATDDATDDAADDAIDDEAEDVADDATDDEDWPFEPTEFWVWFPLPGQLSVHPPPMEKL
jgi:hypothetical protein